MKRKFTNITCIYHDDKNYIPARYSCPDLEIDDVILDLTTNAESNYEKIASMIVDYSFALFCSKANISDFPTNPAKYNRKNWKLLEFKDNTVAPTPVIPESDTTSKKTPLKK